MRENLKSFSISKVCVTRRLGTRLLIACAAVVAFLVIGTVLAVAPGVAQPVASIKPNRAAIERQLAEMLDMKNEAKDPVFVRWQQPIRYYLEGLEKDPALEKLFEAQAARIARLTGLNIARHRGIYLAYKDESRNVRQRWPDGLPTTAAIFFSADMEKSFRDPRVVKIIKGFGDDPNFEYRRWKKLNQKVEHKGHLLVQKDGMGNTGMVFFFRLQDMSGHRSTLSYKKNTIVMQTILRMVCVCDFSDHVPSILNSDAHTKGLVELSAFDKALLKAYYSPELPAVTTKRKALRIMTDLIVRELEATKR